MQKYLGKTLLSTDGHDVGSISVRDIRDRHVASSRNLERILSHHSRITRDTAKRDRTSGDRNLTTKSNELAKRQVAGSCKHVKGDTVTFDVTWRDTWDFSRIKPFQCPKNTVMSSVYWKFGGKKMWYEGKCCSLTT